MIYISWPSKNIKLPIIDLLTQELALGKVVVLPTDTIYGFSCLASNRLAVRRIYQLKQRPFNEPLLILVSSLKMLREYVQVSASQMVEIKKNQKGKRPTTFVLTGRGRLSRELASTSGGLAVRLPKNDFLIKIINKVGQALVSTSFNITGQPPINDLSLVRKYFPDNNQQPDLILDTGICRTAKASRLLDLRVSGRPTVLRK